MAVCSGSGSLGGVVTIERRSCKSYIIVIGPIASYPRGYGYGSEISLARGSAVNVNQARNCTKTTSEYRRPCPEE